MAVATINPALYDQTIPPTESLDALCSEIQAAIPLQSDDSLVLETVVDAQRVPGKVFDLVKSSFVSEGYQQDSKGIYIPVDREPEMDEVGIHRILDPSPDLIGQILAGDFPRFYQNDELTRLFNLNVIAGSQIMLAVRSEYVPVALKRIGALMQREGGTKGYHSISISKLHPGSVPLMGLSAPIVIRPGCRPVDVINVQKSLVKLFSDLIDLAVDEPDKYLYGGKFGGCIAVEETNGLLYRSQGTLEFKQAWQKHVNRENLPQFEDDLKAIKAGNGLAIISKLMADPNTLTQDEILELDGISSRAYRSLSICLQDPRMSIAGHRSYP